MLHVWCVHHCDHVLVCVGILMTFKRGDVRVSWLMCLHVNHFILSELNQNEVYVVLCEQYMFVCFVLDGSVSIVRCFKRSE